MSSALNFDHEAQKIFERMQADFFKTIGTHASTLSPVDLAFVSLQVISREIAEHRLRTGST